MDEGEDKKDTNELGARGRSNAGAQPPGDAGRADAWRRHTPRAPLLPHTVSLHNLHNSHISSLPLRRPGPPSSTMQLGSTGVRPVLGRATNHLAHPPGLVQRSIHLPSVHIPLPRPRVPAPPAPSTAQKIASGTRTLFTRIFANIAAPGLRAQAVPAAGRSLHTTSLAASARAHGGIGQNLSLPARHALRGGAPHVPRAPAMPRPCSVTNVGLGSARSFHSGRPLFQNVVNAPILGRAVYEADMDGLKAKRDAKGKMRLVTKDKKTRRRGQMMKARETARHAPATEAEETMEEERERYFPAKAVAPVTTHLLVPLAPTPTARMPLPQDSNSSLRLLPLSEISRLHASHSTHALRVSSLFARLDAGDVWVRGARTEAYGDPSGVCTVLRIVFEGWNARQVRQVIGEAGLGWCELHEIREDNVEEDDVLSSGTVTPVSEGQLSDIDVAFGIGIDPSQSFVLPTLDFSSSFTKSQASSLSSSRASSAPSSPVLSRTSSDLSTFTFARAPSRAGSDGYDSDDAHSDSLSDCSFPSSDSDDGEGAEVFGLSASTSSTASRTSWVGVGFSSRFVQRMENGERPREALF